MIDYREIKTESGIFRAFGRIVGQCVGKILLRETGNENCGQSEVKS